MRPVHSGNSVVNKIFWKKIILNPDFLLNLVSFYWPYYEKQKRLGTSYQTLFSFLNMFKSLLSLMIHYLTNFDALIQPLTLREKCPYSEFFWSKCGKIWTRITPNMENFYAVWFIQNVRENHFCGLFHNIIITPFPTYFQNHTRWTKKKKITKIQPCWQWKEQFRNKKHFP